MLSAIETQPWARITHTWYILHEIRIMQAFYTLNERIVHDFTHKMRKCVCCINIPIYVHLQNLQSSSLWPVRSGLVHS